MKDAGKYDSYSDGGLPNGPYQEPVKGAGAGNALPELPEGQILNLCVSILRNGDFPTISRTVPVVGELVPFLRAYGDARAVLASQSTPVAQDGWHDQKLPPHGPMPFSFIGLSEHAKEAAREYAESYARRALAAPTAAQGLSDAEILDLAEKHLTPDFGDVLEFARAILSANRAAQETK